MFHINKNEKYYTLIRRLNNYKSCKMWFSLHQNHENLYNNKVTIKVYNNKSYKVTKKILNFNRDKKN